MKTTQKHVAIVALSIVMTVTWPLSEVNATEEEEGDFGARAAIRKMELQDENGQIPPNALSDAYAEKEAMPFLPEAWSEFVSPAQAQAGVRGGSWVSVGPGNVGGRIRSIIIRPANALYPEADRTMWAGGVAGGVWKSTNSGRSWSTNTDRLANLAVNCMALEPGYHAPDHDVLYAGTGEGFNNGDALKGNGIYKTTDGGASWNVLPFTYNNPDFGWVNRLAISPSNSQLLLATVKVDAPPGDPCPGCPRGKILRSTNGGTTWTTTSAAPFPAPMIDVRFKPNSTDAPIPDVPSINCMASVYTGQAYYSTDEGATWVTRANNLGLAPPVDMQRVEFAYSRSNPYIVYASKASVGNIPTELFRSENGGFSFASLGHPHAPTVPDSGLPGAIWYTNVLWVDPTDPQTVVVGGIFILRTRDGGAHWDEAGNTGMEHLDHHAIVEDPLYDGVNNNTVYQVNDGGIHVTGDILRTCDQGPCVEWMSLNNRLSVTQFYGAAGHGASGTIIGGTQDNGTVRFTPAHGAENWDAIFGGDNAACAIDQTDQPYLYGEWFNLQIFRNKNDGSASEYIWGGLDHANGIPAECNGRPCANGTSPFVIDPNPNQEERILAGGKSLWRTTNARTANAVDVCWAEIKPPYPAGCVNTNTCDNIAAIAVAEGDSNLIWIGYNNSSVFYTTNGTAGGTTCPSPSSAPTWIPGDSNNVLPRFRYLSHITIAYPTVSDPPEVARTAYATFGGFFPSTTDTRGNVWKRGNNGTWTDIHHNLPRTPVFSLVISPSNSDFLYVGTEVGVFASANGGQTWSPAFGGSSADTLVYSLVSSAAASEPDIIYVGTEDGVFASKDEGETWAPGFGGPANTRVAELFWMINGPSRKLVVATHGRGMFTLATAQ